MRLSVAFAVSLILALSVLVRAATFSQRNMPTFFNGTSQSLSHLVETSGGATAIPSPPIRKNSLLRNIDFPDLTPSLVVRPTVGFTFDLPGKVLVSASLFGPLRPPSC